MSAVYAVIVTSNHGLEIYEVYAGANAALARAFALAKSRATFNKDLLIAVPSAETFTEDTLRWVFVNAAGVYVAVHFQHILINPNVSDPLTDSFDTDQSPVVPVQINNAVMDPIVTYDDPYEYSLPGGWFLNKKPATMRDLWDTPELLQTVYNLGNAQMWALARARIAKRPNFHLDIPGFGIFDQARALKEIDDRSVAGEEIVEDECSWLEDLRVDRNNTLCEYDPMK